ncbi:MAG TPA: matrixin family metalloprotease [Kofleriaceae bacterium]|nr:matrixin family metalloprotease [Kofleriaceae bacterium]
MSRILVAPGSLLVLVLAAGPAGAYELQLAPSGEAVRWRDDPVLTEVAMDVAPAGVGPAAAEAAARRALASWSQAGAPEFVAPAPGERPELVIRFASSPTDPAIDPAALALTHLDFDSLTGGLNRVEIAVNGFAFRWAAGDACATGADDYQYDLESTLAHEVGHAVGLRHSEDPEATMFTRPQPCARERRDLADDDLAAIAALYGGDGADDQPVDAGPPAGCAAAGETGGGAPILFIAAGAMAAARRRRRAAAARCAV